MHMNSQQSLSKGPHNYAPPQIPLPKIPELPVLLLSSSHYSIPKFLLIRVPESFYSETHFYALSCSYLSRKNHLTYIGAYK